MRAMVAGPGLLFGLRGRLALGILVGHLAPASIPRVRTRACRAVRIVPVPALTYQEPILDLASVQGWRTLDELKEAGRLVIPH
jgi:hypothetical protein